MNNKKPLNLKRDQWRNRQLVLPYAGLNQVRFHGSAASVGPHLSAKLTWLPEQYVLSFTIPQALDAVNSLNLHTTGSILQVSAKIGAEACLFSCQPKRPTQREAISCPRHANDRARETDPTDTNA